MREPDGFRTMALVSMLVHGAFATAVVLGPGRLIGPSSTPPPPMMVITLGGGGAARTGGMTSMGGTPVQTTEPATKPEAVRPPAAKAPEMTLPRPNAKPTTRPVPPKVTETSDEARGTTPKRGKEIQSGSAVAETGARGQGFGLSSGGGAGSGSRLDVANFCCPDYIALMSDRIRSNWNDRAEVPGLVVVRFTIQRDGTLTDIAVEQRSDYAALNLNAQRAVIVTRQLPPLPAAFTNPTLTVYLTFEYKR